MCGVIRCISCLEQIYYTCIGYIIHHFIYTPPNSLYLMSMYSTEPITSQIIWIPKEKVKSKLFVRKQQPDPALPTIPNGCCNLSPLAHNTKWLLQPAPLAHNTKWLLQPVPPCPQYQMVATTCPPLPTMVVATCFNYSFLRTVWYI